MNLICQKNDKNFRKRAKTEEELRRAAKFKQSWKGSGNQNSELSSFGILKPATLTEWEH